MNIYIIIGWLLCSIPHYYLAKYWWLRDFDSVKGDDKAFFIIMGILFGPFGLIVVSVLAFHRFLGEILDK